MIEWYLSAVGLEAQRNGAMKILEDYRRHHDGINQNQRRSALKKAQEAREVINRIDIEMRRRRWGYKENTLLDIETADLENDLADFKRILAGTMELASRGAAYCVPEEVTCIATIEAELERRKTVTRIYYCVWDSNSDEAQIDTVGFRTLAEAKTRNETHFGNGYEIRIMEIVNMEQPCE